MTEGRISDDWSEVDDVDSVVSFSSDDEEVDRSKTVSIPPRPATPLHQQPPASPPAAPVAARPVARQVAPPSLPQNDAHVPAESPETLQRHSAPFPVEAPASRNVDQLSEALEVARLAPDDLPPQFDSSSSSSLPPTTSFNTTSAPENELDDAQLRYPGDYHGDYHDHVEDDVEDVDEEYEDEVDARDPNAYRLALSQAILSLKNTAEKATKLGASRISTLSFLLSTCGELLEHARELAPILASYARRWKDGSAELYQHDLPLSPSLLEWISHLRRQLYLAQAEMAKIPTGEQEVPILTAESIPLAVNIALAGCAESLEDALTTIEDFMPIFKTDFDETQTRRMNIPTREVGEQTSEPRRQPPHPDVARLRQEMYALKDQLVQMTGLLNRLCTPYAPPSISTAPSLVRRLDIIIEVISTLLTNNASEWFESGQRTISYDEFVALDTEVVSDVTGLVADVYEALEVDDPDVIGRYTAEMIQNHQIVVLNECGKLYELTSTIDFLESLVIPAAQE